MRACCLIAIGLLVAAMCTGCGSSWIAGNAVKSPIDGAEVKVFRFDAQGNLAELPGANAPVMTGPNGAYAFGLDVQAIADDVAGPLIIRTVGGVMGNPPATAPTLEAVIPNPIALANQDISVTTHLSLASSVAAGLLRKQALELGATPTVSDAEAVIAQVEGALGVDLAGDPKEPAEAVCMLNTCVDQNLDLVSTPGNNPAVSEFIDYLAANLSSSSGLLDGTMDDPASPGTDIPASFSPFKSGVLTSLLPGGPSAFMNLAFSTDKEFVECNGLDYACLTATLTDAEGTPLAAIDDVSIAIVSGAGVLGDAVSAPGTGEKRVLLTSTTVGDVVARASHLLANGNIIAHDLTIGVINLHVDTDGDGFSDGAETVGWDIIVDENGYGGAEFQTTRHVTSDPNRSDTDMDGLTDYEEYLIQCDPQRVDTDGDGLTDHAEWTQWMSNPCSVDSDSDARGPLMNLPPSALLFDGNEVHLNGTSPTLADTDGDGWTDRQELDHPARSPIIADLPRLSVEVVDAVDVRLDVEYAEEIGKEREYGTESTTSHTDTWNIHAQQSVKLALGAEGTVKAGWFQYGEVKHSVSLEFETTVGGGYENASGWQEAYQDYVTDSRNYTETAASGSMSMGVQLDNSGDTTFTLTHLAFAVRHWKPGEDTGAKSANGSFSTLATLAPELGGGITLAPGQVTPVIQVQATDVNASRIKEFLAQPASLHIEPAAYEIENAAGLNFDYLEEITRHRTARLTIDYGDGRLEDHRVATNAKREPGGTYPGVTLGVVMGDILGIPYVTRPRQSVDPDATTNEQVLFSVRDVETNAEPAKGFWVVSVASDRPEPQGVDFDDVVLYAADEVLMAFIRDEDEDGLFSPEEQHYRTDDAVTDQDGDGLTDAEEVRAEYKDAEGITQYGGWEVSVYGSETYHVFSDPTSVDQDGDGLSDFDEKTGGTDPTLADTDGDGLSDSGDPYPLHPAGILYVKAAAEAGGNGLTWGGAFNGLQDALDEAASRNSDVDNPGNDISEIWVAAGLYKPGAPGDKTASFELLPSVGVYGGFQGVDTETKLGHRNPNPLTNGTVLSGDLNGDDEAGGSAADNSYHVVSMKDIHLGVLDGFQITAGNGGYPELCGGGIIVDDCSVVLRNLFFRHNHATNKGGALFLKDASGTTVAGCTFSANWSGTFGGGLGVEHWVEPSDAITLHNCEFSDNSALSGGGLSYQSYHGVSSPVRGMDVRGCTFLRNRASHGGGGVYVAKDNHHITDTHFRSNQGGGLLAMYDARLLLRQSVWWNNTCGSSGAGVRLDEKSCAWLQNCTIVANRSTDADTRGGGIFIDCDPDAKGNPTKSDASVENCILWGNTAKEDVNEIEAHQIQWDGVTAAIRHPRMSCVEDLVHFNVVGSGNTGVDPKLTNAATGDLRIGAESSCIDTGRTLVDFDPFEPGFQPLPDTDIGGQPRVVDGDGDGWIAVDMGAHEYQGGGMGK